MKSSTQQYISRVNQTFDYIEANLSKEFTLEELSKAANFSKFHFARVFHAIVGETPFQFIQRLRVEKAASLIYLNRNESITEIAYRCGFNDISIFSRNFKKYFKVSPSKYRKHSNFSQVDSSLEQEKNIITPYFCPKIQTIKWTTNMKINKGVEVKELPELTLAYVRKIGEFDGNKENFQVLRNKLFTWAAAQNLLGGENFKFLVMYHDNPEVATNNKQRMSLCISVPQETKTNGEISIMKLKAGKYAVGRFELKGVDFKNAWNWMYGEWLPQSGYQPDDRPCYEDFLHEPQDGNYTIDICIPVKAI